MKGRHLCALLLLGLLLNKIINLVRGWNAEQDRRRRQ